MARNTEQKIKLLVLYDFLREHTDEEHHLSTDEVVKALSEKGIPIERQALLKDIRILNEWGYEVLSYKKKSYYFYVVDRKFDVAELRILIDAVQSASFISEERTEGFSRRIAALAGEHKGELLKKNTVCYDTNKRSNKQVFYTIDLIETAIENGKQVSFLYYDFDTEKRKIYRKDGARYTVNPLALIFTNDRYYLVCYNDKYQNLSHYRIDRIESLSVEETPVTKKEKYQNFNIHKHKKEIFSMYVGEPCEAELEADNDMVEDIMDKFGEEVHIHYRSDRVFRVKVTVQLSPPFFAWIAMFEGKIRIKAPDTVKREMQEFISHTYICQ